ncbi:hypothetical protein C2G38_2037482 [Gigaspora rosea]|uniref:Uncharacterized protein n=1 Tax=Gigaspora rosea TaxID=44941 RepID=A0A397V765_9GLOM|nr:hypothetical protein C2G38_2037482 [Gigaspora rosea]
MPFWQNQFKDEIILRESSEILLYRISSEDFVAFGAVFGVAVAVVCTTSSGFITLVPRCLACFFHFVLRLEFALVKVVVLESLELLYNNWGIASVYFITFGAMFFGVAFAIVGQLTAFC